MEHVEMLMQIVDEDISKEFYSYLENLITKDDCYAIDGDFLGFMEDYRDLAIMLKRHVIPQHLPFVPGRNFKIVDVGCASGLQHLFFKGFDKYIGIDDSPKKDPKFFVPNASFVRGKFREVVDQIEIDEDTFGIANMSLLYQSNNEKDIELFNKVFIRKFII